MVAEIQSTYMKWKYLADFFESKGNTL
jgi:hypothetical protein